MIQLKLRIREDTCCIPSKTQYIGEPAPVKNGIHYFGKKPDPPTNWRDWDKKLSIKETD